VLIENDHVRFYITGSPGADGCVPYAGWVMDADLTRAPGQIDFDGIDGYYPLVNVSPIAAASVTIEQDGSEGGEARVRVEGRLKEVPFLLGLQGAMPNPVPVDVTLNYVLGVDDHALRVETHVINRTDAPQDVEIGDVLQLSDDESEPYAVPSGFELGAELRRLDALGTAHEWRPVAYALFQSDSQFGLFSGSSVRDQVGGGDSAMWGATFERRLLEPGEELEVTRYLSIARDISSALATRLELAHAPTARVRGRVHAGDRAIAGARVTLFEDPELRVFAGQSVTSADGTFDVVIKPGHFYAVATGRSNSELVAVPGRKRELADGYTRSDAVELYASDEPTDIDLSLGETAHVKLVLRDADGTKTSGKITFQAEDARPEALLSAGERVPYPTRGVRQIVWVPSGDAELDIEPGVYTIIASRGFDSSLDVQRGVELRAGDTHALELKVARVVEHTGYVAIDSHVHGVFSQHGETTLSERVITAAAEGLRVHVATDHDWIADYSPSIPWAGIAEPLLSMPGVELTTIAGHHCMWPLEADPTQWRGGALRWWDGGDLSEWYRQYREKGAIVRQVAHGAGYFAAAGYDLATGTAQESASFTWDFNAMEVHNNKRGGGREQLVPIWMSLIRANRRIAPLAASDSHGRAPEVGSARTYVRVEDGPQLTAEAVARAVTEMKTIPSTGPFIDFHARANGSLASVGDTLQLPAAKGVELQIRVEAPDWMPITSVQLFRSGELIEEWDATTTPSVYCDAPQARWFEHVVTVKPDADAWYVVQARGDADLGPVYPDVWPWALTSPIFIDVDVTP
jgi:hypothetical protein